MGGPVGILWKDSGVGLPDLSHFCQELRHSVWVMGDGRGKNLPVQPVTIHPVPVLSGRHDRRVAVDTPKYTELCHTWPTLGTPPPKKKQISQNVLRVFTKGLKFTGIPGGGMLGKFSKTDKYPDSLRAPTPAGHGVDPGGSNTTQYELIPLWNVFP